MTTVQSVVLKSVLVLVVLTVGISTMHWLAAPEGYGASAWAEALPQIGHPTLGSMLRPFSNGATTRAVSGVVERTVGAPRNELLHNVGRLYIATTPRFPIRRLIHSSQITFEAWSCSQRGRS
jgi:hypothetical protein